MNWHNPWRPEIEFVRGGLCAIRKRLQVEARPCVPRGCIGTMWLQRPDGKIVACFQPVLGDRAVTVAINPRQLEAAPYVFTAGFNVWNTLRMPLRSMGMIITDWRFPKPGEAAYERFDGHVGRLQDSRNLGVRIFDHVDAMSVGDCMVRKHHVSLPTDIGLVVCEAIWPWRNEERHRHQTGADFTKQVALALMAQFTRVPVVLLCRREDAREIRAAGRVRRFEWLTDDDAFYMHYNPLQMQWGNRNPVPVEGHAWELLVIHPCGERLALDRPLWLPALVLKHMFLGRRTLMIASGTLESAVYIYAFISCMCDLHGYDQNGEPDPSLHMPQRMPPVGDGDHAGSSTDNIVR
jgi:hypothetical protein